MRNMHIQNEKYDMIILISQQLSSKLEFYINLGL